MPKDYTNKKIGKLTLLQIVGKDDWGSNIWSYKCDCGNVGTIDTNTLRMVKHKSCGCNSKFNNNPRVKNHVVLKAWCAMMARCYEPTDKNFHNYGGRGILVCEKWHLYNNFYDDMIESWIPKLQIDRTDNNKGYSPENCKWVTHKENSRNTRAVRLNKEKANHIRSSNLSNKELAEVYGVHYETIRKIRKYNETWVD